MNRKYFSLSFGVAVCLYAIIVVVYAHYAVDIGLTCAFETTIRAIHRPFVPEALADQGGPRIGDQVLSVGGVAIDSWSSFLRGVHSLPERANTAPRVSALTRQQLETMASAGQAIVRSEQADLVRVVYQPADGRSPQACWCLISAPPTSEFIPSVAWFFVKMSLFAVGALVFWRRPNDVAAHRFFWLCVCTVGAFMGGYHWLRIASSPALVVVFMVCAMMLPSVSLHFYLVFPQPKRFLEQHPIWTLGIVYGLPGLLLLVMLITLGGLILSFRLNFPAEVVNGWSTALVREIFTALPLAAVLFLACLASLLHSYRATPPGSQTRHQVKWIFAGAAAAAVPIGYTLFLAAARPDQFGFGGATWPMFISSLCITLGYGISISRYGLMSVSEVLNLQILSIGVSVGAGIVFSLLVFLGMVAIDQAMGGPAPFWQAAWVTVVAWAMLAATHIARDRLRQVLHRRLHKTKFALDETLRRMTLAVEQRIDPVQLGRRYLLGLAELIGFEQGALYLRSGQPPVFRLAAHLGTEPATTELAVGCPLIDALEKAPFVRLRPGQPGYREPAQRQLHQLLGVMALPLRHEGSLLAVLIVGPASESMSEIEALHLLTTFSQMAGIALHSVQSHENLEGLHRELQAKVDKIAELQQRIVALQSQLSRQNVAVLNGEDGRRSEAVDATVAVEGIVAASDSMRQLLATVRKVAASPSAALIRGESGTGKEVIARALHEWSPRAKGPFVKVHCAALSPGLLESELFGHVKGAFTGAHRDKAGRFELADKGTLFLDEIGDISLEVQTKLLRVLQEMTFERVGSSEPITVDVRVVAATNQDLEKLMREGRFREDLFFRLNVITIRVPPLRERREDILELALHFLRLYTQRNGRSSLLHFDDDALALLKSYSWPGNVRELENVVERAVVLADGEVITPAELPDELRQAARVEPSPPAPPPYQLRATSLLEPQREWTALQEATERQRLVQALSAAGGNKARAARALGMPRSTFLSKLEKYGLVPRRN